MQIIRIKRLFEVMKQPQSSADVIVLNHVGLNPVYSVQLKAAHVYIFLLEESM